MFTEPLEGIANIGKQDKQDLANTERKVRIKKYVCDYENCKAEFSRPWRLASHKCIHTGEVCIFIDKSIYSIKKSKQS